MVSRPFHFRRHRRQDGIDIATGFQPKDGAAVVQQIEFDITSAPDQLLLAVICTPWCAKIAPDKFGINFKECAADVPGEGEVGVPVAAVVPVVKNAANAARLPAMRKIEVFVAPFLVLLLRRDSGVSIAGGLHRLMKSNRVGVILGPPPVEHRR